jgi:molybdopterin-guanine dinucleotide biosynthesis protein A
VVAAEDGQYSDMGLTTIGDLRRDRGPLGGLATALADFPNRHPDAEWLLLVACDLIDPDPGWVAQLIAAAGESPAVAFRDDAGWQPLFALYHKTLLPDVTARLDHTDLSLQAFLNEIGADPRPTPAAFRQASFPEDLTQA